MELLTAFLIGLIIGVFKKEVVEGFKQLLLMAVRKQ